MRKFLLLIPVFIYSNSFSRGSVDSLKTWKKGGTGALNFSQASFSNWAAGGENAISGAALFNVFAIYKKNNISWENTLDMAYSFLQTDKTALHKNDDKIDFTSKCGYKANKVFNYAGLMNFKSQFSPGYNYPNDSVMISDFLAPAHILLSTGIDYKPNENLSCFVSPVTGKITIVNNQTLADAGSYGVSEALFDTAGVMTARGKKIRYEFGALISVKFKTEIAKNITLETKADFFSNYLHNPQNIDVNWDLLLNLKVNKFISASITTTFIYDDDTPVPVFKEVAGVRTQAGTGPRTQFKEVFAVGFSYKF